MSIFAPPHPIVAPSHPKIYIIPHDAQTVPLPPHIPEPPKCMFYGWVLEPELFGPGDMTLYSKDDRTSTVTLTRPASAKEARDTFEFVAVKMGLRSAMRIVESSNNEMPHIASFAEVTKDSGVRSCLSDTNKIPPAATLQKLARFLHLTKKPDWIEIFRSSVPDTAFDRTFEACLPAINFKSSSSEAKTEISQQPIIFMFSPFASHLGTNYCPTDEEVLEIQGVLVGPTFRLKCLDDEITDLRKTIDKLATERDRLTAYVEAHKALLSPFRRLPLDVIEEIFMACLPTARNCVMSATEAPVILGRICSSWRSISLSMPRLWCRIHIVEPLCPPVLYRSFCDLYQAKVVQRLEVTNAWLQRSGNCPLSISLEGREPGNVNSPSPSNFGLFLDALIPLASRWQNISLVGVPQSALPTLSNLGENDVPLLKRLVLTLHKSWHPSDNPVSQFGILQAQNLSSFSISGSKISPADLPLRWIHLTALSLGNPALAMGSGFSLTCTDTLDILSRSPHLRTCKLLVCPSEERLTDSIYGLPFLHTFDLHCVGAPLFTSTRLLSRLSLPELQDFGLHGLENHRSSTITTADSFMSSLAASSRLNSIGIDSDSFTRSSLSDFLRGLPPTIQRLHITEPSASSTFHSLGSPKTVLNDKVLAALNASPDGPAPCPALQELVMVNCRKVSDKALHHFIIHRSPALRHVDIHFERERQIDILPSLQPLIRAGLLKISVAYTLLARPSFSPWQGLPDAPPVS